MQPESSVAEGLPRRSRSPQGQANRHNFQYWRERVRLKRKRIATISQNWEFPGARSPQAQANDHYPWDCCVSSDKDRGQWLKDRDWLNAKQLLPKHLGKYIIFQNFKF